MALKAGRVGVNPAQVDELGNIPIPAAYELPKATASVLGGVKVGDRLAITSGGVLSADAQLPETALADAGKVLTVNAEGDGYELATASGGGGDLTLELVWSSENGSNTISGEGVFVNHGLYLFILDIPGISHKSTAIVARYDANNYARFNGCAIRYQTDVDFYAYKAQFGSSSDLTCTFDKPRKVTIKSSDASITTVAESSNTKCYAVYHIIEGGN